MIKPEEQQALTAGITDSFDEMIQLISSFDDITINQIPFEGSWTAGQVVDHILKGTSSLPDQMTKQADRRYDLHAETLEKLFLDFSLAEDPAKKEFFNLLRSETIRGFATSKEVMLNYNNYKIAPGYYHGCVSIKA